MKNKIYLIGNAHLDPIWQWRWQEGCGEVMMTFRSALDRLAEYPDFIFTCSSAAYYSWVEEIDPEMFAEITQRVKEGRWIPVNGWWIQPDCNLPSGESFARHALYSQLYYYEKFGRICRTGYNIDSFGHSAALPQLLKLGGMNAYVMMRPGVHENPDIPQTAFIWEGIGGAEVAAYHLPTEYGRHGSDVLSKDTDLIQKLIAEKGHDMMQFYGVGNHGGGPTKADLDYLTTLISSPEGDDLLFSDPDRYFEALETGGAELPHFSGELQHHACGCYSIASLVKKLNRTGENALYSAEKWSTAASLSTGAPDRTPELREAWKNVLFNQFHDILGGCSIMEAYEDVKESVGHALSIAHSAENAAHLRIISAIDTWVDGISDPVDGKTLPREFRNHSCPYGVERPIVVFNPHAFEAEVPVRTYHPTLSVRDSAGKKYPFQNIAGPSCTREINRDTYFIAKLPPMGYETFWLKAGWNGPTDNFETQVETALRCDGFKLKNEYLTVEIDGETGLIKTLADNSDGVNILSSPGGLPIVIDDSDSGSWGNGGTVYDKVLGYMEPAGVRITEKGPVRATIRVDFKMNSSNLTVDYSLTAGMKTLEMSCKAIWQEKNTMLKFAFPVIGSDEINTAEIPFGFISRACTGDEESMHRWADISFTHEGRRRGFSVINDCKYSYSCPGKEIRITALRNNRYACGDINLRSPEDFNYTDEGLQRFSFSLYPHFGTAEESDVVKLAALFNEPPVTVFCGYHKGSEPQKKSWLSIECEKDNVALSSFKFAEDGSGALIVRAYETKGIKSQACVKLPCVNTKFRADFAPHQIKTWRISSDGKVYVTDFLEGTVR